MRIRSGVVASTFFCGALALAADRPAPGNAVRLQDVPLTIGTPGEVPTRVPEFSGTGREIKIRVNRIWKTGPVTHAAVRVQNTAATAFNDVSITCTAVDRDNRALGTKSQDVPRDRLGVIRPGAIADLDLVFDTANDDVRTLTCDARAHGLPHRID